MGLVFAAHHLGSEGFTKTLIDFFTAGFEKLKFKLFVDGIESPVAAF